MFLIRILCCSVVAVSSLQINLDLTEWTNVNEDNNELSHDCLHIDTSNEYENYPRQITSYCLSEWPSTWKIEENHHDQKFTFAQLANRNITSEHLYLWSSPMDTIESYQFYLDQRSTSTDLSLERKIYYNCSEARFGPLCQYEFDDLQPNYTSINEMVSMFYRKNMYTPTNLTCYMHLECNLGSTSLCLDWNHICDNVIQCMNGEDEEHCWQMETNECTDKEFRCKNGQCISSIFLNDDIYIPDCLDGSDIYIEHGVDFYGDFYEPTLRSEDIICWDKYHPSVWSSLLCSNKRIEIFYQSMSLVKADSMSGQCWSALQCYLQIHHPSGQLSDEVEQNKTCQKIIEENCTDMFYMPSVPIAFGHMYLAYRKEYLVKQTIWTNMPEYLCYNEQLCQGFNPNDTVIAYNNSTCRLLKDAIRWIRQFTLGRRVIPSMMTLIYMELFKCNTLRRNNSTICNHVGMYKCLNSSKCIAKIRLFDGNRDCDYGDDEDDKQQILIDTYCSEKTSQFHLNCSGTNKCISRKMVEDSFCDCGVDERGMCHDEDLDFSDIRKQISFPTICDGFVDLEPLIIDEQNHTDETDCEQWLCKNIYTHCNGYWNCFGGIDEVNCYPSLLLNYNCSSDNHLCVKPNGTDLMCLPIDQSNDGKIDCLGATDEPQLCRSNFRDYASGFYCEQHNQKTDCIYRSSLCSGHSICSANEDEQFCHMIQTNKLFLSDACEKDQVWILPEREEFLCNLFKLTPTRKMIHFSLGHVNKSSKNITKVDEMISMSSINETNVARQQRCYRGLNLRIWLDKSKNISELSCLCPPSYYGNVCQYQNQRVSLTIKLQSFSDSWRTPFVLIVFLIDNSNERIIHSYNQITYLSKRNCHTKYNMYLLYSTRPKTLSKKYSIHIDVYEKFSLSYRGSLLVDIPFLFLPIQRIAVLLNIPYLNEKTKTCSNKLCLHGQCMRYFDHPNGETFCHCNQRWTGRYCDIPYKCSCSSDSLCLGISANNRSICLCPIQKWGSQCLLSDQICQKNNRTCENHGQCIPIDQFSTSTKKFECMCSKAFFGERCEIPSNNVTLSFAKDIVLTEKMLIHFIEVKDTNTPPEKGVTFKTTPINGNSIVIFWSNPFHIVIVELLVNRYYLVYVNKIYHRPTIINKIIKSSDYCPHIRELSDQTFVQLHILRRIKSYHNLCQKHISCFYDEKYLCLCMNFNQQRQANCLEFNHTINRDCSGKSICENGGDCSQDSTTCPQTSICICPSCFYGTKCQFSSNEHELSLDAILGYHIRPYIDMRHQPTIVKFSIILTVIIAIIGLINGIFSLITFQNKTIREIGCGIYLFVSSIVTLFTISILVMKVVVLILAQSTYMTNRSFLHFQCVIIDYFLQISLNMNEWLNACVALERAFTVIKGIHFNKKNSRIVAKLMIIVLLIVILTTHIQDPIHRRLIDEDTDEEKRIWCIVTHSASVQRFNISVNIFHLCIPFIINLFSAIIIIVKKARLRSSTQTHQTYKQVLIKQWQEQKHLFISSLLIFILTIPRLIIIFAAGCMTTAVDSWLYLMGYFISFFPSMLTFVVFVVPSKLYKREFRSTMRHYRKMIKKRLQRNP